MSPIYVPGKVTLDNGTRPAAIAGVAPTLDYRFKRDKREIETVSLSDKLTFTRSASCAYTDAGGNLRIAGANVPRFDHDPVTGESLGLLLEAAGTNLTLNSEDATGKTNQTAGTITVTTNTTIAPDGNTTADTIAFSSDISNGRFQGAVSSTSGVTYTASFWIKHISGGTAFSMWDPGSNTIVNYNATASWQRFSLTFVAASTSGAYNIRFIQAVNSVASSFAVWGHQIEASSYPTSYIPTTTSTVTRTETAVIDGTGVITGTYTMVEKPASCAVVNGTNIELQPGYTAERVMVFPAALSAQQITDIRSAM